MKITYFGHSAFMVESGKYEILIDPFLRNNPLFEQKSFDSLHPDYILVTHGHGDHLGDTIELAKKNNSIVIAPFELASFIGSQEVKTHPMHIGGAFQFPFGRVKLTIAVHGSAYINDEDSSIIYTGNPCGFLLNISNYIIYHAGDTGLFYDMKLIGDLNKIDLALLPIGDNFTMGIDDAVKAVEFLNPKKIIPIHYNTFDLIKSDPLKFQQLIPDKEVIIMQPNTKIVVND